MSLAELNKPRRKYHSSEPPLGLVEILADMLRSALASESSPTDEGSDHRKNSPRRMLYPMFHHSLDRDETADHSRTPDDRGVHHDYTWEVDQPVDL